MVNGASATTSTTASAGTSAVASSAAERMYPQSKVEEIVQERLGRERRRLQAEIDEIKNQMPSKEQKEEYERLKKEEAEREQKDAKTVEDVKELLAKQSEKYEQQLAAKDAAFEREKAELKGQLVRHNIDSKLRQLALDAGTLPEKVDQVVLLLKNPEATGYKVSLNDEGGMEFETADGKTALDKKGALVIPQTYVEQFLDDNKHLLRADVRDGGAGISGVESGKGVGKPQLKPEQAQVARAAGLDPAKVAEHQKEHLKKK